MSTLPISVHTITLNAGKSLDKALKSVLACREKIIVDGGSTDETLEIAAKHGARVIQQSPPGKTSDFSAVRTLALEATTEPWVLVLDSDEYISEELLKELSAIVENQSEPTAYLVPRKYVLSSGEIVERASTYPNERIFFFHRDAVKGWIKPVHERVEVGEGIPIKRLNAPTLAPLPALGDYYKKNRRYLAVEMKCSRGKTWAAWFIERVVHTVRSRLILAVRLLGIWLIPGKGARMPLQVELARFWYGWLLIWKTCPLNLPRENPHLSTCVATVVNDDFVDYFIVLIHSILHFNPGFNFPLKVFYSPEVSPLSDQSKARMSRYYPSIEFIEVDNSAYEHFKSDTPDRLYAALLTIASFSIRDFDRVVFLDSDMICQGDISELFTLDTDFAACSSGRDLETKERRANTFRRRMVFNTGVLVIGKRYLNDRVCKAIFQKRSGGAADQDVLNRYFRFRRVFCLDHIYNYHAEFFWHEGDTNIRLLHFAGKKPKKEPSEPRMKIWLDYFDQLEHAS